MDKMIDIRIPQKYRWEGKWPKSQPAQSTPNGGDAYLFKNKTKEKLPTNKGKEHRANSMKNMRHLVIVASGKRKWVNT